MGTAPPLLGRRPAGGRHTFPGPPHGAFSRCWGPQQSRRLWPPCAWCRACHSRVTRCRTHRPSAGQLMAPPLSLGLERTDIRTDPLTSQRPRWGVGGACVPPVHESPSRLPTGAQLSGPWLKRGKLNGAGHPWGKPERWMSPGSCCTCRGSPQ